MIRGAIMKLMDKIKDLFMDEVVDDDDKDNDGWFWQSLAKKFLMFVVNSLDKYNRNLSQS